MKEPLLGRTLLFGSIGGRKRVIGKTLYQLDWNLVDTALGLMLEPRSLSFHNPDDIRHSDTFDEGFTSTVEIDENVMQATFNTGGNLFFRDFNPY